MDTIYEYGGMKFMLEAKNYLEGGRVCINLLSFDEEFNFWEPFANLTINIPSAKLKDNEIILNTNVFCFDALDFVESIGLGEDTGRFVCSGFCCYPIIKINPNSSFIK